MDQATQQNAALVEQVTAAASSLKVQAQDLVQVVESFMINEENSASNPVVRFMRPGPNQLNAARRPALT
jgi:hypothetical protein